MKEYTHYNRIKATSKRAKELSAPTEVPTPFILVYYKQLSDCHLAEEVIHKRLKNRGYRVNDNREFFRKISINIERDFDYIRDAKYLEYDVYKLSEIKLSFRLYSDSDVIRLSCMNKEFVYSIQTTDGEMEEIADNIISKLNIIKR